MQTPCLAPPPPASLQALALPRRDAWPAPEAVGLLDPHDPPLRQRGGRTPGQAVLHEFLQQRSAGYRGGISSPLTAPTACSRLSPYLALGCLGMREVVQATQQRQIQLKADDDPLAPRQRQGLAAFMSRMHWHCHFIQKLESEPELEWRNLHRGYDGLREDDWNPAHFEALQTGRTGWPMVDACVAMLRATGWLNFRMRAMLVSVAAYPLWLHWRPVGLWLARQFLDYEPGIHWSQMQMQAGTTGINTTRVYTPSSKPRITTPKAFLCAAGSPTCATCRTPGCWSPGACPPTCKRAAACCWAATCPNHWWTWPPRPAPPRPGCMHCAPSRLCAKPRPPSWKNTARAWRAEATRAAPPARPTHNKAWSFEPCTASRTCRKSPAWSAAGLLHGAKNGRAIGMGSSIAPSAADVPQASRAIRGGLHESSDLLVPQ